MWIFTDFGFFSVVQKTGTSYLTVRSRVRDDLDRLRGQYLPELSETVVGGGTDYPFRATVGHADFSAGLSRIAATLDYSNFKSRVAASQGHERSSVYGRVWEDLLVLEESEADLPGEPPPEADAAGGVVVDEEGRVLLRKPTGEYGGYSWTFAKGRLAIGESLESCALREVREELGLEASIVEMIPGLFRGDTSDTRFFLMEPAGPLGSPDSETSEVRWATLSEARELVSQTRSAIGRARDLEVLDAVAKALGWHR